jgi:DNA polymerase-3 subunit delta
MKLTYFQLEPHLAKKMSPIYIVSGDELLLKQEAINLIRKAAKQAGFNERLRLTPEAGYDWEQLYTLLYSTGLFAEKRLIELDFRDSSPNKTASKILQEYGANPSLDAIVLLDIGKIDDKISRSAWYKALEKIGAVLTIWPIPREQLPQWIMNHAKKYKLQFNRDAAILLAEYIEGNLVAAAQAIEKVYLLQPQKSVDVEMVKHILTDESRFTVFDFIETMIARDKPRTLHILDNLKNEGTEPVLILWAITRELRLMADLAQQLKLGETYENLFQKYRIFARRQQAVKHFLSHCSAQDCWRYLSNAVEIDRIIKGAGTGNVWDALQMFCLRLSAGPASSRA